MQFAADKMPALPGASQGLVWNFSQVPCATAGAGARPWQAFTANNYSEAYAFNVQQPRLPGVQVSHSKRNPAPSNLP